MKILVEFTNSSIYLTRKPLHLAADDCCRLNQNNLVDPKYQIARWSVLNQKVEPGGGLISFQGKDHSASKPSSRAMAIAWVRRSAPSLPYRWLICDLTVLTAITSKSAISWFVRPEAIRRRMVSSR